MTFEDRILNKATLLNEAEKIVKNKPPYKKFIDGTPLSNDIAVWMADFVYQHTTDLTSENNQLRAELSDANKSHGKTLLMCEQTISELRAVLKQCENALNELLDHGNPVPNHITGEPVPYQSNPQVALDALASVQNALKKK